ncbi:MAG: DUF4139 domain-containing protein [Deltaproteobacteria bacterium]|nr:DUF4139 domain-containing protein [Deltaproteobacteria bacterium]
MLSLRAPASRIEAVTVYRSGARISRRASLTAPDGGWPGTLVIPGLPLALEDGTLRVRFARGSGLVATSTRVVLDAPQPAEARALTTDETALEEARLEESKLSALREELDGELSILGGLGLDRRPFPRPGDPPIPIPTRSRLEALDGVAAEIEKRKTERRRVVDLLEEISERRRAIEARIREAATASAPKPEDLRKAAVVVLRTLDAANAAADLEVEYFVPGARWAPSYTIHFDAGMERARLGVRAMVTQRSGEDWTGVKLRLSSAESQTFTELPELHSLRIGRRQPRLEKRGWRPLPAGAAELFEGYDATFASRARSTTLTRALSYQDEGSLAADDEPTFGAVTEDWDDDDTSVEDGGTWEPPAKEMAKSRRAPSMRSTGAPAPPAAAPMVSLGGLAPGGRSGPRAKKAAMDQAEMMAPMMMDREGGGLDEPPSEPELERSVVPAMLDYDRLRLADARESRRGALVIAERDELYAELFVSARIVLTHELLGAVGEAQRMALGGPSIPPRFSLPQALDGFDHAFSAEGPADVPSDGTFHSIAVLSRESDAAVRYVTVPREAQDVFRFAFFTNPLDAPLLAGPADVYVGGSYLMSATLHSTPPKGKIELGLGVEQSLKVARNASFVEETAGLMRGSLALKHEIRIDLVSLLARPAEIEVRERVPVSREGDEDVKVEVTKAEPALEAYEQTGAPIKGSRRWRVTLSPGQSRSLLLAYAVKIAAKNELAGGNRRES